VEERLAAVSGTCPGILAHDAHRALAINNPRALPQQSLSSVTNVDNLEDYIATKEQEKGKTYLRAIDLPVGERKKALGELALMGISAGSLFPGLDGVCGQLRERFFDFE
jgi:hypothetical protein